MRQVYKPAVPVRVPVCVGGLVAGPQWEPRTASWRQPGCRRRVARSTAAAQIAGRGSAAGH